MAELNPGGNAARMLASWASGIDYEINFWTEWARTAGGRWPQDFAARVNPDTPVLPWIADLARAGARGDRPFRVLDVGAGPITLLGHRAPPGVALEVVPTDPLAEAYAAVFDREGVARPNPTRFAPAEFLSAFFEPNGFDLVHCANALDHAIDPMAGILEMLRVVRPGGQIVLAHGTDEAENEGYTGFHQHNFRVEEGGRFVIWRPGARLDVGASLPVAAEVAATGDSTFTHIRITKLADFPPEPESRYRAELRDLVLGVVRHLVESRIRG